MLIYRFIFFRGKNNVLFFLILKFLKISQTFFKKKDFYQRELHSFIYIYVLSRIQGRFEARQLDHKSNMLWKLYESAEEPRKVSK